MKSGVAKIRHFVEMHHMYGKDITPYMCVSNPLYILYGLYINQKIIGTYSVGLSRIKLFSPQKEDLKGHVRFNITSEPSPPYL